MWKCSGRVENAHYSYLRQDSVDERARGGLFHTTEVLHFFFIYYKLFELGYRQESEDCYFLLRSGSSSLFT